MKTCLTCLLLLLGMQVTATAGECNPAGPAPVPASLLAAQMDQGSLLPARFDDWHGDAHRPWPSSSRHDYYPNPGEDADRLDPHANWLNTGNGMDITASPPSQKLLDKLISSRALHHSRRHEQVQRKRMRRLLFGLLAMGL